MNEKEGEREKEIRERKSSDNESYGTFRRLVDIEKTKFHHKFMAMAIFRLPIAFVLKCH